MKDIIIIYDDTIEVSDRIKTIIGKNHYGEVILKRKSLFQHFKDVLEESGISYQIYNINSLSKFNGDFLSRLDERIIFHYFSNNPVNDREQFQLFLNKIPYAKDNFKVFSESLSGIIFKNKEEYSSFIETYRYSRSLENIDSFSIMNIEGCLNISVYQNLLYYISGGFDARYFNSISGDEYTVVKSSTDKKKMNMEYKYYYLLPDFMKKWMVMPYDLVEDENKASYKMERMPMTDIAIRWTHGAVDVDEVDFILDKAFYFIKERPIKKVSSKEYKKISDDLYLEKLDKRIADLKKCSQFDQMSLFIQSGTSFNSIDEIIDKYKDLYFKITRKDRENVLVIGHGDLFFANMLYSKELNMLKLIDPKGGLEEKDLWMHPYYDVAKLSHSICGKYDFFNVDRYRLFLDKNMNFKLEVNFDNSKYVEVFKKYLLKNGFDYNLVRLYEASLFLSMLPLHIDNPHKVFGFLINAINILEEVQKNV